jgi:3-oxoacyl-[acyl-carrier protein] reductase
LQENCFINREVLEANIHSASFFLYHTFYSSISSTLIVMSPSAIDTVEPSIGEQISENVETSAIPLPVEEVIQDAPAVASTPAPRTIFPTLAGKVALITGSGRGIGKGMALELAAKGASVVINYAKSADKAQEVVKEIVRLGSKAVAIKADVSKPDEIYSLFEQAVSHFGKLDIVISNSGTEVWAKEEDVTPADFDYIFNINCRGQFFVAQQGLKYLGQGGRIILMSSIAASMTGIANHALYAGSKAAIEGFTRSFAVDCGEKGITVNAIAPGGIKTDMFDENAWVRALTC